ncbi:trans-aconitate 2-methyltransferase [Neisseria weixii]|uniref:trans-aconitate 2-methyltransferase n=1 Tax=Neisseria weixii TaxID=1853276 RepID=UPI0035A10CF5
MTQPSQHWQPDVYQNNASFVAGYGAPLIDLLKPQAGESILDLGCGDGVLTRKIADSGCCVLGLDGSTALLEAAREKGIETVCGDGQKLDFDRQFDAVFSNAALHWMTDAAAVVKGVARALKKGGRFVAEMGGAGNIAAIQTALEQALAEYGLRPRACWYFPTAEAYRALLQQQGFAVRQIGLYERPTPLPTGVAGWLEAFGEPMLPEGVDKEMRGQIFAQAARLAEQKLPKENGQTVADYVRLRFEAQLSEAV